MNYVSDDYVYGNFVIRGTLTQDIQKVHFNHLINFFCIGKV